MPELRGNRKAIENAIARGIIEGIPLRHLTEAAGIDHSLPYQWLHRAEAGSPAHQRFATIWELAHRERQQRIAELLAETRRARHRARRPHRMT
jgi:hypothetical protein